MPLAADLLEFAVSLTDLAFGVLAEGFAALRADLRANQGLRSMAAEMGIESLLTSDDPSISALRSAQKGFATEFERRAEAEVAEAIRRRRPSDGLLGEEGEYDDPTGAQLIWLIDPLDGTSRMVRELLASALDAELPAAGAFAITLGAVSDARARLGVVRQLRVVGGQLARGDLWVGGCGLPTAWNGQPVDLRGRPEPTLEHAVVACTVPEVMFPLADDGSPTRGRLLFDVLRDRVRQVRTDLNAVGAMLLLGGGIDAFLKADLEATDVAGFLPQLEGAGVRVTDLEGRRLQLDAESLRRGPVRDGRRDGTYQILAARPRLHQRISGIAGEIRDSVPAGAEAARSAGGRMVHGYQTKARSSPDQED